MRVPASPRNRSHKYHGLLHSSTPNVPSPTSALENHSAFVPCSYGCSAVFRYDLEMVAHLTVCPAQQIALRLGTFAAMSQPDTTATSKMPSVPPITTISPSLDLQRDHRHQQAYKQQNYLQQQQRQQLQYQQQNFSSNQQVSHDQNQIQFSQLQLQQVNFQANDPRSRLFVDSSAPHYPVNAQVPLLQSKRDVFYENAPSNSRRALSQSYFGASTETNQAASATGVSVSAMPPSALKPHGNLFSYCDFPVWKFSFEYKPIFIYYS